MFNIGLPLLLPGKFNDILTVAGTVNTLKVSPM